MGKIFLGALFFCFIMQVNAQEFNKWSVDFGAGVHQITKNISPNYDSGNFGLGQASLGLRYMLNEKFGFRLGLGYNEFAEGENSLPFRANYYRINIEGIVNAGNLLNFSSWTKRFNLLFHAGVGMSTSSTIKPINQETDIMTNIVLGLTPQFKLSNRISLFFDTSIIFHQFQHYTFDGAIIQEPRIINPAIINTSLGVNISIGKQKENADFLKNDEVIVTDKLDDIVKRLDKAETEIATLKTKKATINKVELVKELDNRYALKGEVASNRYANVVTSSNVDLIRKLLNDGYINVYFDVNKKTVQKGSLNSVNYLTQFMKDNPNVSALLIGYADETGKEKQNQILSKNRAKSVFDILVSAGISANRLSYAGGGEDKSVTTKARQFARKVIFKIN
ncbi:OmpA family protein [uncultured Polaribacter sp.]|jgi:OOP family OmpA-OmpF porin|uniref:OmpA family protein n=1 Tax=uncultured Polaribacter sp. TaxID=174711 RepID=UPI002606A68A|nr:OmpA family protein [uncultured Polaribacter sp.]